MRRFALRTYVLGRVDFECMRRFFPIIAATLASLAELAAAGTQPIATFNISEQFGVSHPLQIIDFDFPESIDARRSYMIGPEGSQVAFQPLAGGKIAVQTNLPANTKRSWQLFAGPPPRALPAEVRVNAGPQFLEILNGLTGVRIARVDKAHASLAPVQGVRLPNGSWSATGPNYLSAPVNNPRPPRLEARTAETKVLESGPLRARIQVEYNYDRRPLTYGNQILIPAGQGYYRSTITLDAGSPSIRIEDETDMDLQYTLNFYKEVQPDEGRYRGHHATSPAFGQDPDGRVYTPSDNRPNFDARREFGYQIPTWSSYVTGNYAGYSLLQRLGLWNPWIVDSGWYWMMYNRNAPADAPLVGIFPGPASRLIGAGNSGPGLMFLPGEPEANRVAAICFQANRRTPSAEVFPRIRVPWAIFVGSKGRDLGPPAATQNIAKQTHLYAGINLNKVYRYQLTYPDPPGGVQPLYMRRDRFMQIVNRVRSVPAYYQYLYNAEPSARPMLDMWRDSKGEKVNQQIARILDLGRTWLDSEVNGEGMHDRLYSYWHGGLQADMAAPIANELLAVEPIAPEMRERLKATLALFCNLLWDDDLVPMTGKSGVNLGTANMPVQQAQYRNLYAILLSRNPAMKEHADAVAAGLAKSLQTEINSSGAQRASPHYADASMEPLLDTAQQLRLAGMANLFQSEPVMSKFARFYMSMLTPPEVRFGTSRKLISIGDGATESSPIFGELGTYLATTDPALSAELMAAWKASGSMHSGFHGTTVLKIDEDLPASHLKLSSAQWPGWCSVLRSGVNTPNESALWFINGDFYSDHRHADQGTITFYALGAPIAIDWGSIYTPAASAPYMHSGVLPEDSIGTRWDADSPKLDASPRPWVRSVQERFADFEDATYSVASFDAANGSKWRRTVSMVHPDDRQPLILINDVVEGAYGASPRVATLNMMARDQVTTPAGPITPALRLYDTAHNRLDLPSATSPASLGAGLNRFHFRGQFGVDWDLYTLSSEPQQVLIGSWGHSSHPSAEAAQFQRTNGQPFHEQQYILRIRGTGALETLIVPSRPGTTPPAISRNADRIEYRSGPNTEGVIGTDFQAYRTRTRVTLTAFDSASAAAYGVSISGGPAEATLKYDHAFLTITGPKGRRDFHLGGDWESKGPAVQIRPGVVAVDFDGGKTLRMILAHKEGN